MVSRVSGVQPSLSRTVLAHTVLAKQPSVDPVNIPTIIPEARSTIINEHKPFLISNNGQRFTLGPFLGKGGMSTVFKVTDDDGLPLAAKFLNNPTKKSSERFQREIELMREVIRFPGVVHLVTEGDNFMIMEYARGGSLKEKMDLDSMTPMQQLLVLAPVCGYVEALHNHNNRYNRKKEPIIHRDLKPSNILLFLENSEPKISDLGLATLEIDQDLSIQSTRKPSGSLTVTGDVLGTPGYMAPEQIGYFHTNNGQKKNSLTPAADRYALGAMIYEILTGELPIQQNGENLLSFLKKVVEINPINIQEKTLRNGLPPLPHNLAAAIMVSLNKDPLKRSISPGRMQREIERYTESSRVTFPKNLSHLYTLSTQN